MAITTERVTDQKGRVLEVRRDIRPVYSNPKCPELTVADDAHLAGHYCYGVWATIDGEPANRRRVGQFIRRTREHVEAVKEA